MVPRRGYVLELDGLRGIAILLVMVHRMFPRIGASSPWPVEAGWIGVDLFFVISGYLITGILLDTRDDPDYFKNFYARRVLRIFPLFYALVGGLFVGMRVLGHTAFAAQAGSPFWYLAQLGNVPEALLGFDPPYWLAPVWSLAIEEQFYWTFPLLVRAVEPRKLARWLIGAVVLALATRIATTAIWPDRERVQYLFTLCRIDTIAAGCLLAVAVRSPRFAALRLGKPLAVIAIACAAISIATQFDRTTTFGRTLGYSVVALGFAALVLLVVRARDSRGLAFLRTPLLTYPGKLCFGLYLLHRPADTVVTAVAHRVGIDDTSYGLLPVKILVALALATVSWHVIEQPFLRLKRKFESYGAATATRASAVS